MAVVLALTVFGAACGNDDPATSPATTATAAEAATPEPEAEPIDAPASTTDRVASDPSEATAESDYSPDDEIRWSDVFDGLNTAEQSCIRELFGEAELEAELERLVTTDDFPTEADLSMIDCLDPASVHDLFVSFMVSMMQSETGIAISDGEAACFSERTADIDWVALAVLSDEASAYEYVSGMARCLADPFIALILEDSGVEFGDLSEDEIACLRQWLAGVGSDRFAATDENPEAVLEEIWGLSTGLLECLPELSDFGSAEPGDSWTPQEAESVVIGESLEGALDAGDTDLFVFDAVEGEFYEIGVEPGTLDDPTVALYDADGWQLDYDDDSGDGLAPLLFWSADSSGPLYVEVGGYGIGSYTLTVATTDIDDDHADSSAGATVAEVGEAVGGSLDFTDDVDFFVFDAVEGEFYEIGVEPGTLEDPTVALYDADGWHLDYDDDSGEWLAPLLLWSADSSGLLYVEVGGYGIGAYTLRVTRR